MFILDLENIFPGNKNLFKSCVIRRYTYYDTAGTKVVSRIMQNNISNNK